MSNLITKDTDELKKLIAENPDLPIVVLAGDCANDGDHSWTYCRCISFSIDEILDCDYLDDDDTVFTDRDEFEEKIADDLCSEYADKPDEELARFLASVENRRSAAGGGAQWCGMAHALKWLQHPAEEVNHD